MRRTTSALTLTTALAMTASAVVAHQEVVGPPAPTAAALPHRVTVTVDETAAYPRRVVLGAGAAIATEWLAAGEHACTFAAVPLPIDIAALQVGIRDDAGIDDRPSALDVELMREPPATVIPVRSGETRGLAAGWGPDRTWMDQHTDINDYVARNAVDLVLLGDSITQGWGGAGRTVAARGGDALRAHLGNRLVANMGISGDRTQHVLWRLAHADLDRAAPTDVVLLIGTNNLTAGDAPPDVALGITAIVERITALFPHAHVTLMPILPRGWAPDDPMRAKVARVNALIAPLAERPDVRWLDLAPRLLEPNGSLRHDLYAGDGLHLAPAGYEVWGQALADGGGLSRVPTPRAR